MRYGIIFINFKIKLFCSKIYYLNSSSKLLYMKNYNIYYPFGIKSTLGQWNYIIYFVQ